MLTQSNLKADVDRDADGIVVVRFHEGSRLSRADVLPVMDQHVEAAGGQRRPALCDIRGMKSVSLEARKVAAGPRMVAVTTRMALIVGNPVSRLLGNFFLRITSPAFAVRLFDDEAEARTWLLEEDS